VCGIAGLIEHAGAGTVTREALLRLNDAQRHRGPDDEGIWIGSGGRVGLAHRRLSIVDLSARGHQPMSTPDGILHVVFNGEIYNHVALRRDLEAEGFEFRSTSDTEVLLWGWRAWGPALFDRLRGMYAFALHDEARRETILARDPLGIKPLYWSDQRGRVCFASEVQALRAALGGAEIDREGLTAYLLWGSIAPPRTLYQGVHALPAGSWLTIDQRGAQPPRAHWRLEQAFAGSEPMDEAEASERLRHALLDSVRHHLVADVPVGAFLSGGVDSSALVGLLAELHGSPIRTVTLSFDVAPLDEAALAAQAARLYGTDHHVVKIGLHDAQAQVPQAVAALDQPSADGVNTYLVSRAAVQAGLKVAVSGAGGDELFGGYDSFRWIPQIRRMHDRASFGTTLGRRGLAGLGAFMDGMPRHRALGRVSRALRHGGTDAGAYFGVRGLFTPDEVRALLVPELEELVSVCDPARELRKRLPLEDLPPDEAVAALEMRQYLECQLLRDTDAMSMRHSLEVRVPLVDRELLRAACAVPPALRRAGPAKRRLREAPRPPVPDALWRRPKQGFTLPFEAWLRSGGIPLDLPEHPWLRGDAVRSVARDFERGRVHWSRLWALLVLGSFLS
jgi:asparagine synthase (glutamine-hydrolysing)